MGFHPGKMNVICLLGHRVIANLDGYSIPVMALVDADPYGVDILSVYKFGSHSMRHEADKLVSPRIEWIGVFGTELARQVNAPLPRDLVFHNAHPALPCQSWHRQLGIDIDQQKRSQESVYYVPTARTRPFS